MSTTNVIGKSITRPDAYDKVTGGKKYPVNYTLPGMLHMKILRSPYPHAKILSIDTSEAEKLKFLGIKFPEESTTEIKLLLLIPSS